MTTDNETTEMWREYRKVGQAKRASNREHAIQVLSLNNIEFESKNGGAHLIVESDLGKIDFWPGTGLWIPRNSKQRHRGVQKLIRYALTTHSDTIRAPSLDDIPDSDDSSKPPWD